MKKYRVIEDFYDMQDPTEHVYYKNDLFPRDGFEPSEHRYLELSSTENKLNKVLIELEEVPETPNEEEPEVPETPNEEEPEVPETPNEEEPEVPETPINKKSVKKKNDR